MHLYRVNMNAGFSAAAYYVACDSFDEAREIAVKADGDESFVKSIDVVADFGPGWSTETLLVSNAALAVLSGEAS